MPAVPALVMYPACAAGLTAAAAVYLWYLQPSVMVKTLLRFALYMSGLRLKYVNVGKHKYCYAERGAKKAGKTSMLLVHGFGSSKDQWVTIVQRLPKGVHVVVVDLLGHGDSSIPDEDTDLYLDNLVTYLHEFIETVKLNEDRYHMVGVSLGGAIAGIYSSKYKTEMERVTLICPALRTPVKTDFLKEIETGHCRLIPETAEELKEMLALCAYKPLKLNDQIFVGAIQLRKSRNVFYRRLFHTINNDKEGEEKSLESLGNISAPVQVIWGKEDKVLHISGVDMLKEKLSCIEAVEIYEECGHSINIDRPGKLVKSLLQFRGEYDTKTN